MDNKDLKKEYDDAMDETNNSRSTSLHVTQKTESVADISAILKSVIELLHNSSLLTNKSVIQQELRKRLPTVADLQLTYYTTCIWFTAHCLTQQHKSMSMTSLPEVTAASTTTAQQTVERDNGLGFWSPFVVEHSRDWRPRVSTVVGMVTFSESSTYASCTEEDANGVLITNNETARQAKGDVEQSASTGYVGVELVTCIKTECDEGPVVNCKNASVLSLSAVDPSIELNTANLPVAVAFPGAVTSAVVAAAAAVKTAESGQSELDCGSKVQHELKDCYFSMERLDPYSSTGNSCGARSNITSDFTTTEAVSNVLETNKQSQLTSFHDERSVLMQDYSAERQRVKCSERRPDYTAEQTSPEVRSRNSNSIVQLINKKTVECSVRESLFSRSPCNRRHKHIHTVVKNYKCNFCEASFLFPSVLRNHERIHTGERPFKCNTCDSAFAQRCQLRKHEFLHTGKKPHVCNTCGSAFAQRNNLRSHEMKHTGEKPHVCNRCGSAFAQLSDLRKHEFLHTGKKPHVCNTCGSAFARRDCLRIHELIHTGEKPHVCNTCGAAFAQRGVLRTHEFLHTGKKPHVCNTCGAAFARRQNLRSHTRRHSGMMPLKSVSKVISKIDGVGELGEFNATDITESESHQLPSSEDVEPKVEGLNSVAE